MKKIAIVVTILVNMLCGCLCVYAQESEKYVVDRDERMLLVLTPQETVSFDVKGRKLYRMYQLQKEVSLQNVPLEYVTDQCVIDAYKSGRCDEVWKVPFLLYFTGVMQSRSRDYTLFYDDHGGFAVVELYGEKRWDTLCVVFQVVPAVCIIFLAWFVAKFKTAFCFYEKAFITHKRFFVFCCALALFRIGELLVLNEYGWHIFVLYILELIFCVRIIAQSLFGITAFGEGIVLSFIVIFINLPILVRPLWDVPSQAATYYTAYMVSVIVISFALFCIVRKFSASEAQLEQ